MLLGVCCPLKKSARSLSHASGSVTSSFMGKEKDGLSSCCWGVGSGSAAPNCSNCCGGIDALSGISGVGGAAGVVAGVAEEIGRSWDCCE
jgi:hypothetical protein